MKTKTVVISIVVAVIGGGMSFYFLDTSLLGTITGNCVMVGGFVGFIYGMMTPHIKG